jgi:hypothetical protein
MSFSAAMLKQMREEGLTLDACIRILEAAEPERSSAAVRQARYRKNKKARDVTNSDVTRDVTSPPNERDNLTPVDVSEASASSHQPRAWALPVGVALQVWQDFKRNRERKRLPNTETAWKTFNDDLKRISSQTGIPPPKLIEMCAAKGWASINDPREGKHGRTNSLGRNQPADGLSSTARAALEVFGR